MAHHPPVHYTLPDPPHMEAAAWNSVNSFLLGFTALSVIAAVIGFFLNPVQFYFSYLVGFAFFTYLGAGALFFVFLQHLGSAAWSVTVRRLAEHAATILPLSALFAIPLIFGIHILYEWSHAEAVAHDPILIAKQSWLNEPFFLIRTFLYIAIWSFFAWRLRSLSMRQDHDPSIENVRKMKALSAIGILVLIITATYSAYDWLMSLWPHWYSTMFGVYTFAGGAIAFMSALILICIGLRSMGVLADSITIEHYHDLGKLLFAFTVFWAYVAFSQYMLIWYGNMPEETIWFLPRTEGGWQPIFLILIFGHFLIPLVGLISRAAKRNLTVLGGFAVWMLIMEFIDLHWIVMPTLHRETFAFSWIDLACWAAIGGCFASYFWYKLREHAIVPVKDFKLAEALSFKNI